MKAFLWAVFCVVLYIVSYYISCNTAGAERVAYCLVQWTSAFACGGGVMYEILDAQGRVRD